VGARAACFIVRLRLAACGLRAADKGRYGDESLAVDSTAAAAAAAIADQY